ncbi:MAG: hypothetical protein KA998_03225 [Rickettsiaceae bacterium]|nr:hypothetical protein [Rickettsiaceae bacterium]
MRGLMKFHDVSVLSEFSQHWKFIFYLCYTEENLEEVTKVIDDNIHFITQKVDDMDVLDYVMNFGKLDIARVLIGKGASYEPGRLFDDALTCDLQIGSLALIKYLVEELHLIPKAKDVDLAKALGKLDVVDFLDANLFHQEH